MVKNVLDNGFFKNMIDIQNKLVEQTRKALLDLYKTNESFYFIVFTITGEGIIPTLSAWSEEALQSYISKNGKSENIYDYKWSYADSPYCDYGAEHYDELRKYFQERGNLFNMNSEDACLEYNTRLNYLIKTLETLDKEGMFSINNNRNSIMINVEEIPPTSDNTQRAIKLNPISAIQEWLEFCAE